ncbi:cytochrome c biogenesis protein CcsA [Pseudodesulfovibrio tunisiensis]|uniref:cytochrome c biogenesis protein CcsA n=1 Tax=Pseudodesulfovibrio tunisiensis TaxID=463192 RepID=UPI001FB47CEF|nr:cytochrome c biogenesis protein CcsA [Pseudodesulfovibrio tunisiensis]
MGLFELTQLVIIAFYFMGALLFLTGLTTRNDRLKRISMYLAVGGFALHTADIAALLIQDVSVLQGGNFYFSTLAWCVLLIYFFLWWKLRLEFLALTALPLALLLFAGSMALGGIKVSMPRELTLLFFGLHIGTLVVTMGMMTMAFGAGLAFIHYNRKIKTKAGLASLGKDTPSLNMFDRVNRWAVLLGFPLYTLGLFSSYVWYWISPGKQFSWDIMNLSSLAVWFVFAFLFHQRLVLGWRGRKPAIAAVWVFIGLAISLIHHAIMFRS